MAKILIVDDSISLRLSIKQVLMGHGHQIIEASNGIEGIGYVCADENIDAIVLDLNMPKLSGDDMLRILSRIPFVKERKIPVIMLTTEIYEDLRDELNSLGVQYWFIKPFNEQKILLAIRKTLGL